MRTYWIAGKDTIADYLVNIHQFRRESHLPHTFKDAVSIGIWMGSRTYLKGAPNKAANGANKLIHGGSDRLGMPRSNSAMGATGTGEQKLPAKGFHDDTWIASLENKLRKTTDDVVIIRL
jgi:hypothetical protein